MFSGLLQGGVPRLPVFETVFMGASLQRNMHFGIFFLKRPHLWGTCED
jgi:hypothetical protein